MFVFVLPHLRFPLKRGNLCSFDSTSLLLRMCSRFAAINYFAASIDGVEFRGAASQMTLAVDGWGVCDEHVRIGCIS